MRATAPSSEDCQVVELRQYTLHLGQRDTLIELFDNYFIEPQEAAGMRVIGQFRDLSDPNKFVWLRGFSDMASRPRSLEAFYFGPVWAKYRSAANATMIDSDNVLLLKPAWEGAALRSHEPQRALNQRVLITIFHLREPAAAELLSFAKVQLTALLQRDLATEVGWYVTNPAENNFPKLPVREGENVLVAVAVFPPRDHLLQPPESGDLWESAGRTLRQWMARAPQVLTLEPTTRSRLGH